jgi:hypothetical protein
VNLPSGSAVGPFYCASGNHWPLSGFLRNWNRGTAESAELRNRGTAKMLNCGTAELEIPRANFFFNSKIRKKIIKKKIIFLKVDFFEFSQFRGSAVSAFSQFRGCAVPPIPRFRGSAGHWQRPAVAQKTRKGPMIPGSAVRVGPKSVICPARSDEAAEPRRRKHVASLGCRGGAIFDRLPHSLY